MSVIFYVDGHFEQASTERKVWLSDKFPFMTEDDFSHFTYDGFTLFDEKEKRHYEMETVIENEFPTVSMNNGKAKAVLTLLGLSLNEGDADFSEIPSIKRSCMMLLNTEGRLENAAIPITRTYAKRDTASKVVPLHQHPKLIDMGVSAEQMTRSIQELVEVLDFAQKNGKGIYWG